ncbi:unnamed protein product [Mucor hiemalis]
MAVIEEIVEEPPAPIVKLPEVVNTVKEQEAEPVEADHEGDVFYESAEYHAEELESEYKDARDMCSKALELDPKYTKALLRRAQVNEKMGTSTSMTESLEDYKSLKQLNTVDAYTLRECQRAERELPTKIKDKMEKEKEEMIGKLKDLGNSLLGKFGLSTDNFQMQPDPSGSGGYSMNFVNKPSK